MATGAPTSDLDSLQGLEIKDPWKDIPPKSEEEYGQTVEVTGHHDSDMITPSMSNFMPVSPSNMESPPKFEASLLNQFDPLAQEDHPPPSPPPKAPQSAPASSSTFPSLGSIARSFTRPRSSTPPIPPKSSTTPERPTISDGSTESNTKQESQFDFQRFLDQMKTKSAEPVAKYLRSFLNNFAKKLSTTNDQIRFIHDFLNFIAPKMRECDIWKNASDQEFDNAVEAMEKLVMNRLYDLVFTPNVANAGNPVTTDDIERDHILSQRIRLFGWIKEEHLDVPAAENGKGFINFAQQELLKINHYKAPRDKLICILNCCKVIFGLIRHLKSDEGADSFIPILIFVVIQANPDNLLSNVEYINRFRNPTKLQSEAGYYLSSLMAAVSFIETMDHASLSNISKEEFERNVEAAIQDLPPSPAITPRTHHPPDVTPTTKSGLPNPNLAHAGEESARPLLLPTPSSIADDTRRFLMRTGDLAQQTISKPLNAIGRIFSEALDGVDNELSRREGADAGHWSYLGQYVAPPDQDPRTPSNQQHQLPIQTPYKPRVRPSSTPSPTGSFYGRSTPDPTPSKPGPTGMQLPSLLAPRPQPPWHQPPGMQSREGTPALDFGLLQREIAQVDQAVQAQQVAARETLLQIFPHVDQEVADMVLDANSGDLGRSIETLLEMGSGV